MWLPAGAAATDLAAALERSGVLTRCVAGHGVRVTVGTPQENERFLEVFGTGELVQGLLAHWGLPVGPDAMRVHDWVQQLLNPGVAARLDGASVGETLKRCESSVGGSAAGTHLVLDVRQALYALADLVADAPAEALAGVELEISWLLNARGGLAPASTLPP